MTEYIVTIKDRRKARQRRLKSMVLPSKHGDVLSRRKNNPAITFYDCASVADGLGGYRDHPILKVPSYTVGDNSPGALYTVESFVQSDWDAYYSLLFEIPVEQWKNNYRKLAYEENPVSPASGNISAPCTYPLGLAVRTGSTIYEVFQDFSADISTPEGRTQRSSNISTYDYCWDSRGLEYRDLDRLRVQWPDIGGSFQPEWYQSDTDDTLDYKITATNDSTAPDVSATLTFSGQIDVYLIPIVGLFAACSATGPEILTPFGYAGDNGMQVLGPWYQVMPRANWPVFADPYNLTDFVLREEVYLSYQKGRSGAVASSWTSDHFGSGVVEGALLPSDFRTGNFTWKSAISNSASTGLYYPTGTARTTFIPNTTVDGTVYYYDGSPALMAMLKIHGQFYYVWSMDFGGRVTTISGQTNIGTSVQYTLSVHTDSETPI